VSGAILDSALGAAPSITVDRARFEGEGALLVDLLAEVGACPSKSDARRQIAAGAIAVNGTPLANATAETRLTTADLIDGRLVVLRRGKRNNYVARVR
jgi:tyrosyl-tRNA synthetase